MKVIAINGSPRPNGNSSVVIGQLKKKLAESGIELKSFNLCEENISPCIACYGCFDKKNNHCAMVKDGLNKIMDDLISADGLILVTPVYTASVTAWMKAFMERASLVSMANGGLMDRKPALAFAIARRAGTMSALEPMMHFIHVTGMISVGSTYWNITFGANEGEISRDKEGQETLNNAVQNFTWLLQSLEYSKTSVVAPKTQRTQTLNFIRDDV